MWHQLRGHLFRREGTLPLRRYLMAPLLPTGPFISLRQMVTPLDINQVCKSNPKLMRPRSLININAWFVLEGSASPPPNVPSCPSPGKVGPGSRNPKKRSRESFYAVEIIRPPWMVRIKTEEDKKREKDFFHVCFHLHMHIAARLTCFYEAEVENKARQGIRRCRAGMRSSTRRCSWNHPVSDRPQCRYIGFYSRPRLHFSDIWWQHARYLSYDFRKKIPSTRIPLSELYVSQLRL